MTPLTMLIIILSAMAGIVLAVVVVAIATPEDVL